MHVQSVIREAAELYCLPDICLRLQERLSDPGAELDELATLLSLDPGLSARVLKLANSAFYGNAGTVESVGRALRLMGANELYNLVLASAVTEAFAGVPADLLDMSSFWRHSVVTGLLTRELGRICGIRQGERLFVAGLLHNIGKLALIAHLPELTREAITLEGFYSAPWEREQLVLGYTFAQVGAELLKLWGMPEPLWELIACQHAPETARLLPAAAAVLHIASSAASQKERSEAHGYDYLAAIVPEAWRLSGLAHESLPEAELRVDLQALEVLAIIAPGAVMVF